MRVLARFIGPNGEISIIEELATGARVYHEEGVQQSYVLPGGDGGADYVALMSRLPAGRERVALIGCGGGTVATLLFPGRNVLLTASAAIVCPLDLDQRVPSGWMLRRRLTELGCCMVNVSKILRTHRRCSNVDGVPILKSFHGKVAIAAWLCRPLSLDSRVAAPLHHYN